MPNWCENIWRIAGRNETEAREIFDVLTTEIFDVLTTEGRDAERRVTFEKLLPMPAILEKLTRGGAMIDGERVSVWIEEADADGVCVRRTPTAEEQAEIDATGAPDWYEWRLAHWGCKWDAAHTSEADLDGDLVTLRFDTPWGPPVGVIDAIRERWPEANLSAFYHEPGVEAAGYL